MLQRLTHDVLVPALAIAAMFLLVRQCRRPAWLPGRLFLRLMNFRHSGVTNWGLSHVPIEKHFTMLDVGCGGGRTIDTLARIAAEGKVYGIDYSKQSVATSRRVNRRWIDEGRVEIRHGSVSSLPYQEGTFDIVTAVETHYYWPELATDLKEILRVLKPGGSFLMVAETYRGREADWLYRPAMKLLSATYLTVAEHRELFVSAGFIEVEIFEERARGWICGVGRKPRALAVFQAG